MKKKTLVKFSGNCIFTLALAVIFFLISDSKAYRMLELRTLDLRFTLRTNHAVKSPVVHIDIDDQSLDKLGRWPWPRSYHAKLIDTLTECGAKQVIFDVLFTEKLKDRPEEDTLLADAIARSGRAYLPFYFTEEKWQPAPDLKKLLLEDISISSEDAAEKLKVESKSLKGDFPLAKKYVIDEVLSDLIKATPDITIEEILKNIEESRKWFLFPAEESYIRESFAAQKLSRFFVNKFTLPYQNNNLKVYKKLTVPIYDYLKVVKGSGYINADRDEDGVMRRVPLFLRFENKVFPQLALGGLLDFLSVKEVKFEPTHIILKDAQLYGKTQDIRIPVDKNGIMLINWAGKWNDSFVHVPYYYILRLQETKEQLLKQQSTDQAQYLEEAQSQVKKELESLVKDKICLVGLTGTGTQDMGPIPIQVDYPYVGVSSNLVNTIISQKFISRSNTALNIFIFLLTSLLLGIFSVTKLWRSVLFSALYALGYFLAALLLFDKIGLWIPVVSPEGIIIFGFSAITSFRYFTEEKEKLWIKQAFSRYLSKEVINELMNDPSKLKLGGERKNITVIFSDVRGFTKFSEAHQPEEIVAMLNDILTQQSAVVFKYNGTLDKFVGDELMAFFGAPGEIHAKDHAYFAVRSAIEMQAKVAQLREHWAGGTKESLEIGIGINSGEMVVGNMGSAEMMNYTVIGDNVNLAARLCSAAAGNDIIISEATYEQIKDRIETEKLEPITVKGKAKPISIFRVIALKS